LSLPLCGEATLLGSGDRIDPNSFEQAHGLHFFHDAVLARIAIRKRMKYHLGQFFIAVSRTVHTDPARAAGLHRTHTPASTRQRKAMTALILWPSPQKRHTPSLGCSEISSATSGATLYASSPLRTTQKSIPSACICSS